MVTNLRRGGLIRAAFRTAYVILATVVRCGGQFTPARPVQAHPLRISPILLAFLCIPTLVAGQAVRAWQDTIHLPTYREGAAVVSPQFAAWNAEPVSYPYPLRTNFTKQREDRAWRTLNLENEYLFCRILPDLGGHLYSCRDKRNGREMFNANPVVKPGPVGLRGAWVAMGIESNFPYGHTRVGVSPVDFALHSDPDGSARAVVEEIDRVTSMQWRVEFILRPGSAVLEQRVILYNRSEARWPYYWWANAGITFDDPGTRLILPAHVVSTHAETPEILPWPVNTDGKDGTVVAVHKDAGAWFAYGSREPFFAVYKPSSRSGVAHFADPEAVPGKKLWLWGSEQDRWVKSDLTDDFPSYVEMQAGVFQNQNIYEFFQPEQFRSFSEFWIPIYDLGGVSRATPDAVLNLRRITNASKQPALLLELSATRVLKNATIRIAVNGKAVDEVHADLNPTETYRHNIQAPSAFPYAMEIADSQGKILLHHVEDTVDAMPVKGAPLGKVPRAEWTGLKESEMLYLDRGDYNERQQLWNFALSDYTEGLRRYPSSLDLKKAAGRLFLNLNRFEEAANLLSAVVEASPSDNEALYDIGVAKAMTGHDSEAAGWLSHVQANSPFNRAATLQLARIAARSHDDSTAIGRIQRLLGNGDGPVRDAAIEIALLRRAGRSDDAKSALLKWRQVDPADSMLRFEQTRLGGSDDDLWKHLSLDAQRVLTLVDEYLALGMDSEALLLLDHSYPAVSAEEVEPGAVPVELNPLIAYYRAFCRARLGQDPAADLRAASGGYTNYLFPYRFRSFQVLQNAVKLNANDALAHFLLGRLYLHSLNIDQAIAEWQQARALNPKIPELHAELSQTLLQVKKDVPGAFKILTEGLNIYPNDAELASLSKHISEALHPKTGTSPTSVPTAVPAKPPAAATVTSGSTPIDIAHAALLKAASGKADEATGIFHGSVFSSEKQPEEVRRAYIEVQLQKLSSWASAGQCPKALFGLFHLGDEDTGLAFTIYGFDKYMKSAHFEFYAAGIEAACQEDKKARKRWEKISKMSEPVSSLEYPFPFLAAWKLNPEEAKPKIAAALSAIRAELATADAASKAALLSAEGILLHAAGNDTEAIQALQDAVKLSNDAWVSYFAQLEIAELFTRRK